MGTGLGTEMVGLKMGMGTEMMGLKMGTEMETRMGTGT